MKPLTTLKNKLNQISNSRKLGLEFLIYNIIGNIFTFLLNLILPFLLSTDNYGYFALLFSIYNLGAAFFTFGLNVSIIKFTVRKNENENTLLDSLISWAIVTFIPLVILIIISYYLTSNNILHTSFKALVLVVFASSLISIQRIVLSYHIATESIKKYGVLFISNKIIQFIPIILVALLFSNSTFINVLPYLFLLQSFTLISFILISERRDIFHRLSSKKNIFKIIKFTLPLSVNTFGSFGYSYGFNVFISPFLTLSQLGILNIFNQLSSIASITINALNNGYIPTFYRNFPDRPKQAIIDFLKYIFQNSLPLIIIVFIVGFAYKTISLNSNSDYSIILLTIYCIGVFLYAFKAIGSNILIIEGKTMRTSTITIFTSVINITMAIIFTKYFGFFGCITSLSIGYILQSMVFNYVLLNHHAIKIHQ
ncbi:lipopolysaccharide biosynthesis protein [Prolixibacter sp. NT017]|uniref:lipopolysaccharide biosynthesis protein n=1 Tax=Prolixibacter sp. NT017 TaxID=2652390 RepID=UPI0012993468|nr:lipopolysaccharide biosynthesis protein [Prolixibacter sp. NT017]